MNPTLKTLRELAEIDRALARVRERRRRKLERVRSAEEDLARARSAVSSHREVISRLKREADELNLELKSAESEIARLEAQRSGAKSNKEYEILTKEIRAAAAKKSELEDGVLERLEEVDSLAEEERSARAAVEEAERALEDQKKAREAAEAGLAGEEEALAERRNGVASGLDPEDLTLYERLLAQRGDSALARVVDGACSACARKLTAQLDNLVSSGDEVVQCMSCRRILYLDDGEAP
jgi:hypothetical protein